eukprot:TRINITY_DN10745_c1_g2_i1.p2 TRINITY_DN10745_c1_g2~~TRINITY_DN10745_c1_g2_i1.p2  ORF type:complete len:142 (+),score=1.13 TRINITY_DN10745_c1_g2_i1:112-537(+)
MLQQFVPCLIYLYNFECGLFPNVNLDSVRHLRDIFGNPVSGFFTKQSLLDKEFQKQFTLQLNFCQVFGYTFDIRYVMECILLLLILLKIKLFQQSIQCLVLSMFSNNNRDYQFINIQFNYVLVNYASFLSSDTHSAQNQLV